MRLDQKRQTNLVNYLAIAIFSLGGGFMMGTPDGGCGGEMELDSEFLEQNIQTDHLSAGKRSAGKRSKSPVARVFVIAEVDPVTGELVPTSYKLKPRTSTCVVPDIQGQAENKKNLDDGPVYSGDMICDEGDGSSEECCFGSNGDGGNYNCLGCCDGNWVCEEVG